MDGQRSMDAAMVRQHTILQRMCGADKIAAALAGHARTRLAAALARWCHMPVSAAASEAVRASEAMARDLSVQLARAALGREAAEEARQLAEQQARRAGDELERALVSAPPPPPPPVGCSQRRRRAG